MKIIWNNFKVAFAMYSKIPMPMADWTPENMRYAICFFPWIGIPIGLLEYLWFQLASFLGLGPAFYAGGVLLIPFFITGGIHYDGFLDTMDAMSSWQERERRLQILKDPHAGAFAIICGCVYFITFFAAATELTASILPAYASAFCFSRCFSGLSVVLFPNANPKGSAAAFGKSAEKKKCVIFFCLELLILLIAGSIVLTPYVLVAGAVSFAVWVYYYFYSKKYFGGITGDLAGYFLSLCELLVLIVLILAERLVLCI